ncbi:MAG: hypothetical protein C4332_00215 [Meiothermus sp.]
MGVPKKTVEPVIWALPATAETFALLRRELIEYSLSFDYSGRLKELNDLRKVAFGETLPSAKVYRGFRKLTDPDPFDD